ncbi:Electron transfer flavoprotein alpha-subunit [Yamadazyma tenuis]|uniref:Probable electron transfer flavoprotein subunit alpha n=1 Tax=Candida tenuis (strain ATCC 10573 / BCRC 21748 / CBS 615 / JCM 9827 / NBRC 10315 / NRRL Y-1498 / VKM Y-70) TaxID=590646 RepID=G3BE45_CANTC|nr:electron transfer flavo protein, alpha subunit [Yamadazyma tenuis ATCC 10573]EGV61151.1 electron transfer flavo protein, alpha subunit [Yamadazyma tenuis ATCC 10573]WEJ94303.1 Electron transfer flavoprotein alpha-subunit [Yamadazyma tenuis]
MFSVFKRGFASTVYKLDTLAFVESAGGKISPSSLSSLNAANQIGKPVTAVVFGPGGESIAADVSKIPTIQKVIQVKGDKYEHYLAEELAPTLKEIIQSSSYTHFLTSASAVGKSVLPRLGALIDSQPVSDILKVVDDSTFVRPIYAGNALATVKSNESVILASVRASAFTPVDATGGSAAIEEFSSSAESGSRTEFVSEELLTSERPELGSATRIVSGGRGLKNKETFDELLEPLATKLNAAIGASRAAVDSGFCDNSLQVGQTGKIVAPELYIAVGISGAIQHLAGMKDSQTIVAINKDPESAIFNVADIGLVGDLNQIIPELTEKL